MAGETYAALLPPTGAAFIPGHAARATQIERVRQCLTILGKPRYWHLGSASSIAHYNAGYDWAEDAPTIKFCLEDVRGLTCTFRVWVKVLDATGTVRARLQNTDDGVTVAEMAGPVNPTAWTLYEVLATPPAGTTRKSCRVELIGQGAYYRGAQLEFHL